MRALQEVDVHTKKETEVHCTVCRSDTQNICQLTAGVDILAMELEPKLTHKPWPREVADVSAVVNIVIPVHIIKFMRTWKC